VLVDFTAVWCGPCKALKPTIHELTIHELTGELVDRLVVGTLDIDEQRPIAERYGISAIPALLVFQRGAQVARIGSQKKDEILAQLAPVL
jgi:thioredoxin 1